jgi:putative ABC transport system substrate-binding protein
VRRREFIVLVGGAVLAWPLAVRAQQPRKVPTIGILALGVPPPSLYTQFFLQALRDLGWIDVQNIVIEFRWAATVDLLPKSLLG